MPSKEVGPGFSTCKASPCTSGSTVLSIHFVTGGAPLPRRRRLSVMLPKDFSSNRTVMLWSTNMSTMSDATPTSVMTPTSALTVVSFCSSARDPVRIPSSPWDCSWPAAGARREARAGDPSCATALAGDSVPLCGFGGLGGCSGLAPGTRAPSSACSRSPASRAPAACPAQPRSCICRRLAWPIRKPESRTRSLANVGDVARPRSASMLS
mmetsp:Transcript_29657/g.81624  ORF Transcript_29657/g.81624 Transcript_29657/m.81624 type:complete len:210 (-) Transcript_29657:128-757(-)